MGELIKSPESAWTGFFRGAGSVAAAMVAPLGFMVAGASKTPSELWRNIGVGLLIVLVGSALVGAIFAIPALLYRRAYERVGGDPDL